MEYLNLADYSAIAIYFLLLIAIGFFLARRASQSIEDYFLGGRKLPWWALGMSGTASWFDITGTMVIVSFLYLLGPRGIYIEFRGGACLVLAFMMVYAGRWHRRSGCITAAEWLAYRFGEGPGGQFARIMGAAGMIVSCVGMLAYMIKGVGLFLSMFLPWSPFVCALIMIAVATVYTMASGFYGVVFTDVIQTLIIMISVGVVTWLAVAHVRDVPDLDAFADQVAGNAGAAWTGSSPLWHVTMPRGYEVYQDLFMFAMFYLLKNIFAGLASGGDPRYFGARNERECGLLSAMWGGLIMVRWPMMISFAVLGLFLVNEYFPKGQGLSDAARLVRQYEGDVGKERWEELTASIMHSPHKHDAQLVAELKRLLPGDWKTKLKMVSYEGTVNPERILPAVLLHRIPMGWRGLLLVAMLAASMSTFDSNVNMATGFFTRDLYQRYLRRRAGNRELITASYAFGIAMVVAGFVLALKAKNISDIWGWIIMSLTAGMAVPGILRLYWWRFNAGGVVASFVVGLTLPFVQRFVYPDMHEWNQFLLVTGITLLAAILGTFLTRPTDRQTLEYFYKTTRPFGFWGPLKKALPPVARAKMRREHRNDMLAIPFVLVCQVTLYMMPMQLVVRSWRDMAITFAIFAGCLLGVYKFWYLNLPPAREGVPTLEEIEAGRI